jgi:hypothetical protein
MRVELVALIAVEVRLCTKIRLTAQDIDVAVTFGRNIERLF